MELTSRMPPELWLQVFGLLDTPDLKALSSICSSMSKWLAPQLFSCLRLSNQSLDLDPMTRFLKRHGHVVTKISYESFLLPNKGDEEDGVPCISSVLQDLLKGNGLPNLNTVNLSFRPEDDFNGNGDWMDFQKLHYGENSIYIHQLSESAEQVHTAESTYQWRADIRRIFDAVSQNTTLEHLEIQNLLPRQCSTWETKNWGIFLGKLSSLKLGIWGGENGAGWHSNTLDGYHDFVKDLGPGFFKHLTKLRRLHLISNTDNALGCEGMNHSPLPISTEDLLCIEDMELENWFIDPALQNFISARRDSIRRIVLTNCKSAHSIYYTIADNPITWATFFRTVRKLQPSVLIQFLVANTVIELDWRETIDEEDQRQHGYGSYDRAAVETIRKQLHENKNLRLFAYASLSDSYGDMAQSDDDVRQSFNDGQDQKEYDALMQVVAKNRERSNADSISSGTKE